MGLTLITSKTEDVRRREPKSYSGSFDPGAEFTFFEDWLSSTPEGNGRIGNTFWEWVVNAGSVVGVAGEASAPGIVQLDTGTNNNGRATIYQTINSVLLGGAALSMQARVRFNAVSTVAQAFTVQIGLGDSNAAADSVDGVYFQHDQTSGNWLLKSRSNNVETSVATTYALSANQWYTLRFEVDSAASRIDFYIGTSSATLSHVGTIATNIPKTTGRETGPFLKIRKTAGTTLRYMHCDYYLMMAEFGNSR